VVFRRYSPCAGELSIEHAPSEFDPPLVQPGKGRSDARYRDFLRFLIR